MRSSLLIPRIRSRAKSLQSASDQELREIGLELKYRAQTGTPVLKLTIDSFALAMEGSRRVLGMVHYDVQLLCGIEMVNGRIAEMKTGEGKTLAANLVSTLYGFYGKGVHVVTFNDYLAERDCELMSPVFRLLGLSADVLTTDKAQPARALAYQRDITYGSAKEFGFDFLRDRMAIASSGNDKAGIMRGTKYAVVDEADSILIDEARTPLIIGLVNESEEVIVNECCRWAASHATQFEEDRDYEYDELRSSVKLKSHGIQKLRSLPQNESTVRVSLRELHDQIENAIKVRRDFQLDQHYAIMDDQIVILDEFTGRPAKGRQWQRGIHQAVQAKEKMKISPLTRSAATITIQSFFSRYEEFCGMTGTAWTSRREFKKVYKKKIVRIPTHRPTNRTQFPTQVFCDRTTKFKFIADECKNLIQTGRSVLIGTRSVEISELLSKILRENQVAHEVLNARNLAQEADLVAKAGQPGRVTVATNMAGRGTDIKLHSSVKKAGGLHVFLTEIHESQRIDWQLIGRASRQGDPGSYQICVSLDDEILTTGLGSLKAERLFNKHFGKKVNSRALYPVFIRAQQNTERKHLVDRLIVLKQDEERKKSSFDTGQDPYLSVVSK